jgi:hypothetical protein
MPNCSADGVIGWLDTRTPLRRLTSRVLVKCTVMDSQEEASAHDLQSFNAHSKLHPTIIGGHNDGNRERNTG